MEKKHRVFVVITDPRKTDGSFTEMVFAAITPKQALINAVFQHGGDYRTENYPKNLPGIMKSSVKDRYYYEFEDGMVAYTVS